MDNSSLMAEQDHVQLIASNDEANGNICDRVLEAHLCVGTGQFHTNEVNPTKPDRKLNPYDTLRIDGIRKLVDNPQSVEKTKAQWLIPSALLSRNFKEQEANGEFWMLWADLDVDPLPVHIVKKHLVSIIGSCQYEIYTSKSAIEECQKARILIPLAEPLNGADWKLCEEILNDNLNNLGVTPDRANERTAQLCYLPNKGKYYKSKSNRTGELFNPLLRFNDAIEQKKSAIASAEQETQQRRVEAEKRRAELQYTGIESKRKVGRAQAEKESEQYLNEFMGKYGIGLTHTRLSEVTGDMSRDIAEFLKTESDIYTSEIYKNHIVTRDEKIFLIKPAKFFEWWVEENFGRSEKVTISKKKGEIFKILSVDDKGVCSNWVTKYKRQKAIHINPELYENQ